MDKEKETDIQVDELRSEGDFESDDENPNVFKIRNPVNPPSAKIFTTQELHTLIHEGLIDLNPAYQRDVVWPETKQIGLIDSIFRNFYIPPVIFAVAKDEDGEEVRVCVDGKQRLTSIQKFFDGQIPHRDTKTKRSYWFTRSDAQKASRLDVPDYWKKQFAEKQITCVEYHGLATGTEREIFQRVQLGMTLTAAEKLQAIDSPWAAWISDLEARHVLSDGGLANVLQWDTTRGRDFQCIAQFVYCCDGLPSQLLPTAQKLEKWLLRVDKPSQTFKAQIHDVLSGFWHLANDSGLNYGFRKIEKRIAPVEFVFIGVLLYVMRGSSHEDRANAVYKMRLHIRELYRDIRNNAAVGKSLWGFISNVENLSTEGPLPRKHKKKRKHGASSSDEDEYRPSPARSLGNALKTRSKVTKA